MISSRSLRRSATHPARLLAAAMALGAFALAAPEARAAQVWLGDFETGDLSQWSALNGRHISVVDMPIIEGAHAAQIQLTNDAVWSNGLKRVELHHGPAAGRTDEGAELYFAWSFQVPDMLPEDPSQQIGYWESNQSYTQMMAFDVAGEHIQFVTRQPQNKVQWEADGMVTAGKWHRIALHIKWSKDPAVGYVDVWFDGTQVVTKGGAKTLADDNDHFTQVGLLRGKIEFQDSPIIFIDDAVEGDTMDDVHPALMNEGGGGAGGAGAGGSPVGAGGSPSGAGGSDQATTSGPSGTTVAATGGASQPTEEDSSCRYAPATGRSERTAALALLLALASIARRRRRPT